MEKGFNDDELADIMNEIESLEKEFAHDDKVEKTETVETQAVNDEHVEEPKAHETPVDFEDDSVETIHASHDEVETVKETPVAKEIETVTEDDFSVEEDMNEVLGELSEMPVEDIVPTQSKHSEEDNIHHLKERTPVSNNNSKANTAMSFHVEGDMKFELSFHIAGKFVGLTVTEEGLEIGLDGGAKFTVPVEHSFAEKKAS
ncbi:MAG: hypothetical protein KC478_09490 [Bacteriovoracaceae bacterium]|nr:hypothetical protein [Bacteriovoracaceae bacterium]